MAKLGWVAAVAIILALMGAWFLWESDINAFLAARPARGLAAPSGIVLCPVRIVREAVGTHQNVGFGLADGA